MRFPAATVFTRDKLKSCEKKVNGTSRQLVNFVHEILPIQIKDEGNRMASYLDPYVDSLVGLFPWLFNKRTLGKKEIESVHHESIELVIRHKYTKFLKPDEANLLFDEIFPDESFRPPKNYPCMEIRYALLEAETELTVGFGSLTIPNIPIPYTKGGCDVAGEGADVFMKVGQALYNHTYSYENVGNGFDTKLSFPELLFKLCHVTRKTIDEWWTRKKIESIPESERFEEIMKRVKGLDNCPKDKFFLLKYIIRDKVSG